MWLQNQHRGNFASRKLVASGTSTSLSSWQHPKDWQSRAGAKPREEVDYSAARQDTRSDRDCRFDQKEECSMIGRDLFNIPCRICQTPREKVQK